MPPAPATAHDIPALVRCLHGGSKAAQKDAAQALTQLSMDAANFSALEAAGAVPAAIRLLRQGSSVMAEVCALLLLGNMAYDSQESAAAAAAAGATELAVQRLRSSAADLQAAAATALGNMALCKAARQAALAAGAVPALQQALQRGNAPTRQASRSFECAAADALQSLMHGPGPLPHADLRAAIPALMRLARSSDAAAQVHAVHALANAALHEGDAKATLARAGAIPALLHLALCAVHPRWGAVLPGSPDVVTAALQALGHLAEDQQQRAAILAAEGGTTCILELQRRGRNKMKDIANQALTQAVAEATTGMEFPAAAGAEAAPAAQATGAEGDEAQPASEEEDAPPAS